MTISEEIRENIEFLKTTGFNGCIAGSSMIDGDYDNWETVPDVDLFVYNEPQLIHASGLMEVHYGYKCVTGGEYWKYNRVINHGKQKNMALSTLKFRKPGGNVNINITYKYGLDNMFSVLGSFDMSIIMVGHDIRRKTTVDLRCGWDGMVPVNETGLWSTSPKIAKPNPLREQDVDMYGTAMWVRQFDRCIKYWDRGYDTRPMAAFYISLIDKVIANGQLFQTKNGAVAFDAFVEEFTPLREKMFDWLRSKEDI